MDTRTWLEAIGCGRYAGAFEKNAITFDLLGDLTDGDLKELGLTIGDRKRFMRGIASIREQTADRRAPGRPPPATHAERRRLTVMFADLVGSTDFSSRLDPEEWSDVLCEYQNTVGGLVTRFDGHVAQYLGDGVLSFFGWPKAMEDAAPRAVEAALEIVEGVARVRIGEEALACRIGIATGPVVVGELLAGDQAGEDTAIGEVLNFAARLQAFAGSGQIVISDSTRRLLGNAFILNALGEHRFKGIAQQQAVFAAQGSNPAHDRFAGREGQTTDALIGREAELALLSRLWERARAGDGQAVSLIGEAGIGKSRVCHALFDRLAGDDCTRVIYQCSPYHRDTALWPVANRLIAGAGIRGTDTAAERLAKLRRLLREAENLDDRQVAIIAELLGVGIEARHGVADVSPAAQRAAAFSILISNLVAQSRRAPALILLEDAHWADPSTLEFLGGLLDRLQTERIMLLVTSRPEGEVDIPGADRLTAITLGRLDRARVNEIIEHLGAGSLGREAVEAIIERTDGVPLFVEELTKAMMESGDASVPASLHDTLMARLDRLPEVKEVAQIASVFGRDFEADPVASVAELSRQRVIEALDSLRKVELVYLRLGEEGFSFKHALVRDATYESLLNRRRRELHGRILDLLKTNPSVMPGVLAQHAAEARRGEEAVRYGRIAAEQALRRPAYAEAIAHATTALKVLETLPAIDANLAERKRLLRLSGQARIAHSGYADPSTVETFAEIERIARKTGDDALLVDGLYGRWAGLYVPGRHPRALEVAETVCEVSARLEDGQSRALGHRLRGTVLTMMGRVGPAAAALDEADGFYDPVEHPKRASRFGQDVGVASKCYRIGVLILAGRFDSAAALAREVLADLDRIGHVHTRGYALGHLALFLCTAETLPFGTEVAQSCIELSERDRLPLWTALGRASLSLAHVHEGRATEAIPELQSALDTLRGQNFSVFLPLLLPSYAIALAETGETAAAAEQLAEARALVEENDARFSDAVVSAAEGQLLRLQNRLPEAEARFRLSLESAGALGHLAWELRAADSLSELMCEAGREQEAQRLLAPILDRFSEGRSHAAVQRTALRLAKLAS